MSTQTIDQAPAVAQSKSLKALTRIEVRRYARHPLFLAGLALGIVGVWTTHDDLAQAAAEPLGILFFPVLLIGLPGTMVAHRLARIVDRAAAATDAAPIPRTTRTAALCLATLFPAVVGATLAASEFALRSVRFGVDSWNFGMSTGTIIVGFLAAAVACAGGPLFGIVTARWAPFPGAGLLAMVLLVAWTLGSTFGMTFAEPTRLSALLNSVPPSRIWSSADGVDMPLWQVEGWPLAYLLYVVSLCFLGAVFAMVKDAQGEQRRRLWRVFAGLAVLTVAMLLLTAVPEPVRIPLEGSGVR